MNVLGKTSAAMKRDGFRLLGLANGFAVSQAIFTAARLGIADVLAAGPVALDDLAVGLSVDSDALSRLLRFLADHDLFTRDEHGLIGNTPMSALLAADHPLSVREPVLMSVDDALWRAWGELTHSVQTGKPSFNRVNSTDFFGHLVNDDQGGAALRKAMTAAGLRRGPLVAQACDLTGINVICDVGGGHGTLLASFLRANPGLRGMLVELPEVAVGARQELAEAGLIERCEVVDGDFFRQVPAGADAYLLWHIIHDWNDEQARVILTNVREAMPPDGRLLVIEHVMRDDNEPSPAKQMDLSLLITTAGKERTRVQFAHLYATAGFRLSRVLPTRAGWSIIEGVPV